MQESVRLAAVGDLILSGRYDERVDDTARQAVFRIVKNLLRGANIAVGNLECPLTSSCTPRDDKLCLKANPRYADTLSTSGFGILSLANNHATDYGLAGLTDTLNHLQEAGLGTVGAGQNLDAATKPIIFDHDGLRIGFLAYCHSSTKAPVFASKDQGGVAELAEESVIDDIRRRSVELDHLVLLLHWGLEYSPMPTPDQVNFAHRAVDAGANLIIGHHSHMIQGIEHYRNAVIAYSLGNCTDSPVDWQGPTRRYQSDMTEVDRMGLALTFEFTKDTVRLSEKVPLWLNDDGQPEPATGMMQEVILEQLESRSGKLKVGDLEQYWQEQLVGRRVLGPLAAWWRRGSLWEKIRGFRPAQLKTLYLLGETWLRIKVSRSNEKWSLFNPRNDTRPMPYVGDETKKRKSRPANR